MLAQRIRPWGVVVGVVVLMSSRVEGSRTHLGTPSIVAQRPFVSKYHRQPMVHRFLEDAQAADQQEDGEEQEDDATEKDDATEEAVEDDQAAAAEEEYDDDDYYQPDEQDDGENWENEYYANDDSQDDVMYNQYDDDDRFNRVAKVTRDNLLDMFSKAPRSWSVLQCFLFTALLFLHGLFFLLCCCMVCVTCTGTPSCCCQKSGSEESCSCNDSLPSHSYNYYTY